MPITVIYATVAMLLVGAAPLSYGYYMLLRLVVCGVFAFAAFIAFGRKHKVLPWVYGFLAVVFNPILKIYFLKETWAMVDILSGSLLLVTANAFRADV